MNYCILRLEKLPSLDEVKRSAMHTFREIPTKNADPTRTNLNKTWGAQTSVQVQAAIEARLPAKRRKDAVSCIEYLITASPEFFKTAPIKAQNDYFDRAVQWLKARHGADNVVCLNIQLDETSPHLVAYVVPLTKDGRLSAKEVVGGPKQLKDMQTDFAEVVGKPAGLQRGIEDSGAVHTTVRQFYQALEKKPALTPPNPPAPISKPSITDRLSGRAKDMEEEQEKAKRDQVKKEAEHAALIEQSRNVALVGMQSRIKQAKAVERLRQEAEEAKLHEREAAKLREENTRLRREMREQRTYFQRQIDGLQVQLVRMTEKVKGFLQKIGLLTLEKERAEAEVEELREIMYTTYRGDNLRPK